MRIRRTMVIAVALVGAIALFAANSRSAYADLPYKAYGDGLKAGQVVEAFGPSGASVGKATADSKGAWMIDILGPKDGDRITFTVDGAKANETVTFMTGQFSPAPGMKLTVAVSATPTPTATPAATPTATVQQPATFSKSNAEMRAALTAKPAAPGAPVPQLQIVYKGGNGGADELEQVAKAAGATGAWVQDGNGNFQLLIVGGGRLVNASFIVSVRIDPNIFLPVTLIGGGV